MITEPTIESRNEQHTLGIRSSVPMSELPRIIPAYHSEIFAYLQEKGATPTGPPFLRLHVIDMAAEMDVEVGVPVAPGLPGTDRIRPDILPAGQYATLIYTGLDGFPGNKALIEWARENHVEWDRWEDPKGDAFRSRVELYLTDPAEEPDMGKWETQVAIKITDPSNQ